MNNLEDFYGHKEYYGYAQCHVPISKMNADIMLMFLLPSFFKENNSSEHNACA